jgi:hypothetical protein
MCYWEKIWLADCPSDFKPEFYRRYVDDTFLLFRDPSHAPLFLDYLNSKHPSIKFSLEIENSNSLSFLDSKITKFDNTFSSSVFRKATFTGLGLSYFSFCSFKFKINAIKTLLNRAYNVCSSFKDLHLEFTFLLSFFTSNGFPSGLVNTSIKRFLARKYSGCNEITETLQRVYCVFPFFGCSSDKMLRDLEILYKRYFPTIQLCLIFVNSRKIGSFFRYKDVLPKRMRASVVYKFSCVQCTSGYVGMTTLPLYVRIAQHRGVSFRSGRPLMQPSHSSVRLHSEQCGTPIAENNFEIFRNASSDLDLKFLESLHIAKDKPVLNSMNSSFPLQVFT